MPCRARGTTFVAIDFETANRYRNSACAVGLVRVEGGRLVQRAVHLIRPPFRWFEFTPLHGIAWRDVWRCPSFEGVWFEIARLLRGVDFVAAHNASFDRGVLNACCAWYGIRPPAVPFRCTVQLARSVWGIRPTKLQNVADHLGLPLRHHDPGSDAEACARIVMSSMAA